MFHAGVDLGRAMARLQRSKPSWRLGLSCLAIVLLTLAVPVRSSHAAEIRLALVVGSDEYKSGKLTTPVNDAGLVADALTAAGFTVTGARNLDQATLRDLFREFLGQVATAGPDAVTVVYLAGVGVQFAGENYFVPVDADLARDVDVPLQAMRVSDFMQPLAALPGRVKIVILDAARQNPFARGGEPMASGLALVDPGNGVAIAFNAAPGTVGPDEPGPYGAYATSLTEVIAGGGLSLDDLFARTRLRVSELTNGGEVPWYASQIDGPFFITERAADAPPPCRARCRLPICAASPCAAIRASRMPMRRRSRSTRWMDMSNFWRSIRRAHFCSVSPPCSRCTARKSAGGAACSTIRRRLIGRISAAIPVDPCVGRAAPAGDDRRVVRRAARFCVRRFRRSATTTR